MKKLMSLAMSGAMLLAVTGPVLAKTVTINKAKVTSSATSVSTTGGIGQGNGVSVEKAHVDGKVEVSGNNTAVTGDAESKAINITLANTALGCNTCKKDGVTVNKAYANTSATAVSGTGEVYQGNSVSVTKAGVDGDVKVSGNNSATTGDASSFSLNVTAVNTSVSGF